MICSSFTEPLYFIYVSSLPSIIYYSYLPAILVSILVAVLVLMSDRKALLNKLLFGIAAAFLVWTVCTLVDWTNIHSSVLLFTWSLLGPAAGFISILSIYFTHVFVNKRDVSLQTKTVFIILLAPLLLLAPTKYTLSGLNLTKCDAFGFEGVMNTLYFPALGALAMVWVLVLLIHAYRRAEPGFRKQLMLMGTGMELFLFSFFTTEFLGQYLVNAGVLPDSQPEVYGYFGMIVFVVYIAILVVRFKAFHVSLLASQALVIALLILIGSQFSYSHSATNNLLNSIALVLTGLLGFILIRNVKKEIQLREQIEKQEQELEKANAQQVVLIHFITHQIKGFVTKSRNIFSMVLEGEFGPVPDTMKPMIEEGFRSDTKGAETIQEILNAANIKSGKVTYAQDPVDLKELAGSIVNDLKPNADAKSLALTFATEGEGFTIAGDRMQLTNAIKNLIDNSIKYTPQGKVEVVLKRAGGIITLVIQDTGVGITPEDMKLLFTEGGHGKESQKVNVESTGFGLYIVKNIIEAHHGRVWVTSEGAGKGSKFSVELPAE